MQPHSLRLSINAYTSALRADIDYLDQLELPAFQTLTIDCGDIDRRHNEWIETLMASGINDQTPVLYYFTFSSPELSRNIIERVKKAKRNSPEFSFPKTNTSRVSPVLYVGKTNSNFISRFKNHLGLLSTKTYGLNLKHWAAGFTFTLYMAKLSFGKEELRYLEMLETAMHLSLQPVLGRAGH